MRLIVAVDPGRDKCGVAVVDLQGNALELELVQRQDLAMLVTATIARWRASGADIEMVLGSGTQHRQVLHELEQANDGWAIKLVEEYGTTLAARELYWQRNQASCWQRLLPASWRSTPPLDAYAAWAIAKRHIINIV